MIIKLFGKKNSRAGEAAGPASGQDGGDEGSKIEYIILIEPLVQILQRPKENGAKLTALSVMALVNLCNYSEDIKDIFLQKNGHELIMNMLKSKDEDILLNNLRLIMTLIAKGGGDSGSMIGR